MVIHSLLQTKKDFKELVSNLFFRIDDLGLGMITISEFEKHFNDEALLHWSRLKAATICYGYFRSSHQRGAASQSDKHVNL